jgi:L-ascorbate metabolism protein UlaG (beta-lactamase superfamily)
MRKLKIIFKYVLLSILSLIVILGLATCALLQEPQFGKNPGGKALERIEKSSHYKDGSFRNQVEKPTISEGYSFFGETWKAVFKKYPRRSPSVILPSVRTDLLKIPADSNLMVWFGHSSVFIQLDGKRILFDPVFSGKASPLPWGTKAFPVTNNYLAKDMPPIDYLLISHDHYDHLDYETVLALKTKVKYVICGLGVGSHFKYWGYDTTQIIEQDWNNSLKVNDHFSIFTLPSHHKSGRSFTQGKTLWASYLLLTPHTKIYISGDGGYDGRFEEIRKKFGPINWAIMEDGQYNKAWQSVHMLPEEIVQATNDLQASNLLPVHNSKFTLASHPWDEPLIRITELSATQPYRLATPQIGEIVYLDNNSQRFGQWWKGIQ